MNPLDTRSVGVAGRLKPDPPPDPPGKAEADDDPRCLVVMYHYVHDTPPLAPMGPRTGVTGLSTQAFGAQLDRLCRTLEPIDWPTLYAWTCGRRPIPPRSFLLTFDDGLADHSRVVLPMLERRGLRGTFFVPGAVLTEQRLLGAHAIHLLLSRLDEETIRREVIAMIEPQRATRARSSATAALPTPPGREGRSNNDRHRSDTTVGHQETPASASDRTDPAITLDTSAAETMYHYESPQRARLKYLLTVALPAEGRDRALRVLFERYIGSQARWARQWYLGWDDLIEMVAHGHTIGGHGYSHEPLGRMTGAQRHDDLNQAAEVLRRGLGPDIRPISYPYGDFDDDTQRAAREAGFAHAFTTRSRAVTAACDLFQLPRVDTIDVEAQLESMAEWRPARP